MKSIEDYIYRKHCCRCPLRNQDCNFKKCSMEIYKSWVEEARIEINEQGQK